MTLAEVRAAINKFGKNFVDITLVSGGAMRGVLTEAYSGHPDDPRGYKEDFAYVLRIDTAPNQTIKLDCSEISRIVAASL